MSIQTYRLPDLLSLFPKKRGPEVNSNFQEAEASLRAWVQNTLLGDCATIMAKCDAPLWAAMVWPQSSYEWLMGVVNWSAAAFCMDDLMDRCPKEDLPVLVQLWLDSLRDGKTIQHPQMAVILNTLTPSMRTALGPYHWPQFIRDNEEWLLSSIREAHGREAYLLNKDAIDDIQGYLMMRRGTSAAFPVFTQIRSNRCLYIPDDVLAHPDIIEMTNAIMDAEIITNDIYSFKKEYAIDKAFANILTVIKKDKETSCLDMQGALDYSGELVEAAMERFHACAHNLPSFNEEIDGYLASYLEGMKDLVVANLQWSRVCRRYNAFANEEDRRNNIVRWAL